MISITFPMLIVLIVAVLIGAVGGLTLGRQFARAVRPNERTAAEQVEFMRNLLAFLLVMAFISVLPVFTWKQIPEQNEQIITYMVGQLSGMALTALGFYFVNKAGQDAVDAKKTENTGLMAGALHKALDQQSGGDPNAIREGDRIMKVPDLDVAGLPWDARIHAADKAKDEAGNWIKLEGVDDALVTEVEAELRAAVEPKGTT